MNACAGRAGTAGWLLHNARAKWQTLCRNLILAGTVVFNTGCATGLGYIPEYPKPGAKSYLTTDFGVDLRYQDVRRWGMDVLDGYDSRSTANRYATYGGAAIGAAAAASLVGLATFDSTTSWIKGIPIGAAFLGSLFALYNNDVKAAIYEAGANQLHRLLNNSDRRRFWLNTRNPEFIKQIISKVNVDMQQLEERIKRLQEQRVQFASQAANDYKKSLAKGSVTKGSVAKGNKESPAVTAQADETAMTTNAEDNEKVDAISKEITQLQTDLTLSRQRLASLEKLNSEAGLLDIKGCTPRYKSDDTATSSDTQCDTYEKLCLRDDVMSIMETVDRLNETLTPADVGNALKGLTAETAKKGIDWVETSKVKQVRQDLGFLYGPAVSRCGVL